MPPRAFMRVIWTNSLTSSLVQDALGSIGIDSFSEDDSSASPLIQWSTYDAIDHSLTLQSPSTVLSSSYVIRKALIRKHFLHHTFVNYLAKHPTSLLSRSVPKTWNLELAFSDELDELWSDELWDLGEKLDANASRSEHTTSLDTQIDETTVDWFILKPGMADRGMGIRLFKSREELQRIFEEFDDNETEDGMDEVQDHTTSVATSQLRHFVVQEYLKCPVLIDPLEAQVAGEIELVGNRTPKLLKEGKHSGRKFHLRVYCVASGALKVYISSNILALFASTAYAVPRAKASQDVNSDLAPHLTNTCLQDPDDSEESVRLLSELVGCRIHSIDDPNMTLTEGDIQDIVAQVGEVLAETFQAALESPVHFQPLPNAFEIFGADLLVTHDFHSQSSSSSKFRVNILELNAEPAIEMTGARLMWIIEDLFKSTAQVCVQPFLDKLSNSPLQVQSKGGTAEEDGKWSVGETRFGLRKCLDVEVRGASAW